jgi:hypothetical protein
MARSRQGIPVYLEIGQKRAFAGAIDWPGWCRSGKGEDAALQALLDYGPRYEKVLQGKRLGFKAPLDPSAFPVVERLKGDASTDFGVPGKMSSSDERPVDKADLKRMKAVLGACWAAFDAAVDAAEGKALRKGPRGGGRDLDKIVQHVLEADAAYLGRLGTKFRVGQSAVANEEMNRMRAAILEALDASAREPVRAGPRGGVRWPPRYFVRRSAWHALDHAWEIEDRAIDPAAAG